MMGLAVIELDNFLEVSFAREWISILKLFIHPPYSLLRRIIDNFAKRKKGKREKGKGLGVWGSRIYYIIGCVAETLCTSTIESSASKPP
jgi:hypothetical protein